MSELQLLLVLAMYVATLAIAVKAGRDSLWGRVWDAEENARWEKGRADYWEKRVRELHELSVAEVVDRKCDDCAFTPTTCPSGSPADCWGPETTEEASHD